MPIFPNDDYSNNNRNFKSISNNEKQNISNIQPYMIQQGNYIQQQKYYQQQQPGNKSNQNQIKSK
jgi:hypothetical protein